MYREREGGIMKRRKKEKNEKDEVSYEWRNTENGENTQLFFKVRNIYIYIYIYI